MRTAITLLVALVSLGITLEPDEQGYGSCYEVRPICLQGKSVCMCNLTNYCFWACR